MEQVIAVGWPLLPLPFMVTAGTGIPPLQTGANGRRAGLPVDGRCA